MLDFARQWFEGGQGHTLVSRVTLKTEKAQVKGAEYRSNRDSVELLLAKTKVTMVVTMLHRDSYACCALAIVLLSLSLGSLEGMLVRN